MADRFDTDLTTYDASAWRSVLPGLAIVAGIILGLIGMHALAPAMHVSAHAGPAAAAATTHPSHGDERTTASVEPIDVGASTGCAGCGTSHGEDGTALMTSCLLVLLITALVAGMRPRRILAVHRPTDHRAIAVPSRTPHHRAPSLTALSISRT